MSAVSTEEQREEEEEEEETGKFGEESMGSLLDTGSSSSRSSSWENFW